MGLREIARFNDKVQESLEEKLHAGDCVNRNVDGQWTNFRYYE
jgi:hypothetical protein